MATPFSLSQTATASSQPLPTAYTSSPPTTSINWDLLDNELRRMLAPVSDSLNSDTVATTEAAESFTSVLREHLIHYNLLRDKAKGPHRERQIVRVTKKLAQGKNALRRSCF